MSEFPSKSQFLHDPNQLYLLPHTTWYARKLTHPKLIQHSDFCCLEAFVHILRMSPIIAGIAAFLSVAAFVVYVIAASGYSKSYKVLKNC